ncbi:MAG: hypothetical protein K6T29_02925 [Peptococcaceae bacterium]|nr:hypothetical protein [Peptococcaceae bacterium]
MRRKNIDFSRVPPKKFTFKGEMVEHEFAREMAPMTRSEASRVMRQNPYKTPPNNLTSKDKSSKDME